MNLIIGRKRALSLLTIACALSACAPSTSRDGATVTVQAVHTSRSPAGPATETAKPDVAGMAAAPQPATTLPDFTALVARQGPAVVSLIASRDGTEPGAAGEADGSPFGMLEPPPGLGIGEQPVHAVGSGIIIGEDGLILTNAHVVAGARSVSVRLAEGEEEYQARIIGADVPTDVALIKIDADGLPVAALGSSSSVRPGEWVATIGSPFGFTNTITAGIVSATDRTLPNEAFVSFIQTDVAVNPGNSGGPLLNLQGQVVGINSMIYSRTGGHMGVSFAIPIDLALEVARELHTRGKVTRGSLGVAIQPMTPELAKAFRQESPSGALIGAVDPESAAERAGLESGDVILAYDGKDLRDPADLPRLVAATAPGREVKMHIWRDGAERELDVKIGEMPAMPVIAHAPATPAIPQPAASASLVLSEVPAPLLERLDIEYGLMVMGVGGPSTDAPLRPGDVILSVNRKTFSSMEEFNELMAREKPGEPVALLVRRGESSEYVAFRVPPREHLQTTEREKPG